jgi:hypothetical protein
MTLREAEQRQREQDEEIARIDAGGSALEGSTPIPPEEQYQFKQPLDKVLMVRLADEHWQLLYDEARRRGIGPSTLIRMLALEKLREQAESRKPA